MSVVTESIPTFLEQTLFIHLGTRDKNLMPVEVMVWALRQEEDKNIFTVFIPENVSGQTLSNLSDNGQIAVTAVFAFTHETYQFKGTYISHRPATDSENAMLDKKIADYKPMFEMIHLPVSFLSALNYKPALAVSFKLTDLFSQTPGPGAGKKIN